MINLFSRESVCFNLLNLAAGVISHDPEESKFAIEVRKSSVKIFRAKS